MANKSVTTFEKPLPHIGEWNLQFFRVKKVDIFFVCNIVICLNNFLLNRIIKLYIFFKEIMIIKFIFMK